jgi:hypothetical protein
MSKKTKDPRRHELTRHHLQCRSNGGSNKDSNISMVPRNQHQFWHGLFSNMLPPTICHIINDKWLDRRWKLICVDIRHADKVENFLKQLT